MATLRIGLDLLSERAGPGGIHTYVNRLLEAMLRLSANACSDERVEFAVLAHDDYPWTFPAASHPLLRLLNTGLAGICSTRRRLIQQTLAPRMAREAGARIVHSVNNALPLALSAPAVVTVHDLSPFELPERFSFAKRTFLRWAVPLSIRKAARILTVSEAVKREIGRWMPDVEASRVVVTPNGVDSRFGPEGDPAVEAELRARHALPQRFVLSVGRGEPGKNLDGARRALERLDERGFESPPWVIVGTSDEESAKLRHALERSPLRERTHVLGLVEAAQLPHLYRMAAVLLFPSLYEGFGLPVVEAMASGTPVVTSNCSSMPEVAGRAALCVDPKNPDAIARAVARCWESEAIRTLLRARGLKRAREFSWDETARRTLEAYRAAAG